MRVDWIIPCRHAENGENPSIAHLIGAGSDTIQASQLPAKVPLTIAVRLTGRPEELHGGQQHTLVGRWSDPDMQPHGGPLSVGFGGEVQVPDDRVGHEIGAILVIRTVVPFPRTGCYTFEVSVDGSGKSIPLYITTKD